jgi:predicted O-linked N-acetylglucosamine transferase (SPINDLY family)
MGDAERAGQAYDLALARDDSDGLRIKRATTLPVVMTSWDHIRAARYGLEMNLRDLLAREMNVRNPTFETSTTNFFLAYHGEDDRRLQELTAQLHLKSCPDLAWTAPHVGKRRKGKTRVGFISAFFRRHSIGRLMEGLIANLAKDEFEIVIITQPGPRDPVARRIEAAADTLIKLPEGFWPARDAIAAAECDVLIYPEIGMDVRCYFMAFARLAPVQAVMWGHPDTTGIPTLDWFVSSELIEGEGAEAHYSEKLYRMKTLPTRYARPEIPPDIRNVLRSRDGFGLDPAKHIYLCQQSVIKHHPDLDVMIGEILRGDPKGEVVLLEGAVSHWSDQVRDRMRASIPDVAGRVRTIPRMGPEDFIALTAAADVVFDAPHWSGGNTSFEAFALGKAVATHAGTFMRGRVTLGQYRAMGFGDEFARADVGEAARLALRLGLDADFRKDAERRVAEAAQKLWDDPAASAEFAAFLRFAHARAIG